MMKKFILALSMLISLMTIVTQPHADDTDLFVIQIPPDVLIILDISGSMNQCPDGTSKCCKNYPDPKNLSCIGLRKLDIARNVIFDLLDAYKDKNHPNELNKDDEDSLNLRMGYMRFFEAGGEKDGRNPEDDGLPYSGYIKVLSDIGDSYKSIWDNVQVDNFKGPASRTPLAATLSEAKTYYLDYVNTWNDEKNVKECRKKNVIFITDGADTLACGGYPGPAGAEGYPRYWTTDYRMRMKTVLKSRELRDAGIKAFWVGFGGEKGTPGEMPEWQKRTLNWAARYSEPENLLIKPDYDVATHLPPGITDPCKIPTPDAGCDYPPPPFDPSSVFDPTPDTCARDPKKYPLTGYAFFATDASELSKALKSIIGYIKEQSYAYTAPSVPTVRMVEGDAAYISYITPNNTPFWQGNLKAYQLNKDGTLPVDENGNPSNSNLKWNAFEELNRKSRDIRRIYTYLGGPDKEEFKSNNSNLTKDVLGATSDEDRNKLINHVRGGMDAYDVNQNGNTTELRDWKLGDIFHSNAAIVGEPSRFFVDAGFNGPDGFYGKKKKRTRVVIVGANDGMLHAFNAGNWDEAKGSHDIGTGAEEWAFIPNSLLKNLKSMASAHTYYVDSSPKVADVWFYSDSNPSGKTKSESEWKTVLVCGLRKGGKHYFALDITDTLNPKYLWEFPKSTDSGTLAKLGESWSEPAIGRVKVEVAGELHERWVAFLGGGFDHSSSVGKAFFVLDIKTGEIIREFSGLVGMSHPLAAPPSAVDTLGSGYVNKVYIGDLAGQMWVFDVSSSNKDNWTGKILFNALGAVNHRIYYQPAVALDKRRTPWVFFGTGDRENPTENSKERFYAVKDDGKIESYPYGETDLKDVTSYTDKTFKTPEDPLKGWYIQLAEAEKVLAKPAVFYNLLYFTTYTHISTDECKTTGKATLYKVEYLSGGGAYVLNDCLLGTPSTRSKEIGEGIPSAPVISVNLQGKASVTIGTTSDKFKSEEAISPATNKEILYWREVIP